MVVINSLPSDSHKRLPLFNALVDGERVVGCLRDTGCDTCVIRSDLVSQSSLPGAGRMTCRLANDQVLQVPSIHVKLDCEYFTGSTKALVFQNLSFPFILGNIPNAKFPTRVGHSVTAIETRHKSNKKENNPPKLTAPVIEGLDLTPGQISKMQRADKTLARLFLLAEVETKNNKGSSYYLVKKDILYKILNPSLKHSPWETSRKLVVVPTSLRNRVIRLAHSTNFSGHLGTKKTHDRLAEVFYWPAMFDDVRRFCLSCDTCQRMGTKPSKVPLTSPPVISEPFERIAVDIIGPIIPCSDEGHRFILVVVDYATRYPLALALKRIDIIILIIKTWNFF